MPPATRTTLTTLQHVLRNVLQLTDDKHHVETALTADDRVSLGDLLTLRDQDFGIMTYSDSGIDKPLTNGVIGKLQAFQSFIVYLGITDKTPTTDDEWRTLTREDFESYRTSPHFISIRTGISTPPIPSIKTRDPLSEFCRGIK